MYEHSRRFLREKKMAAGKLGIGWRVLVPIIDEDEEFCIGSEWFFWQSN